MSVGPFFAGLSEGRKNQIKFRTALVTSAVHLHGKPEPREIEAVQESVRENLRLDTGGEEKNFPAELDDIISGGYVPWDHLFEMERAIDRTDHGVEDIENTISILERLLREVNRDKRQILNPEEELDEYAWYLFKVRLHFRRKQHIPLFITRDIPEGSNVGDVIERIPRNKVLEIYPFTDPQDIQSRDLLTTYPHNPQGLISIPRLIQADELREQWCEMAALLGEAGATEVRFTRKYETGTESTREHVAKARTKFKPVKFVTTADGRFEREESNSETSDRSNELFATFEPVQRSPAETQERVLAFRKTIKWLDPKASETSVISNIANLMHTTTLTTFTENISLTETSKRTMDTKAAFNMVLKFLRPVEAGLEASYNGDVQETATSRVSGTLSVARNLSTKGGA